MGNVTNQDLRSAAGWFYIWFWAELSGVVFGWTLLLALAAAPMLAPDAAAFLACAYVLQAVGTALVRWNATRGLRRGCLLRSDAAGVIGNLYSAAATMLICWILLAIAVIAFCAAMRSPDRATLGGLEWFIIPFLGFLGITLFAKRLMTDDELRGLALRVGRICSPRPPPDKTSAIALRGNSGCAGYGEAVLLLSALGAVCPNHTLSLFVIVIVSAGLVYCVLRVIDRVRSTRSLLRMAQLLERTDAEQMHAC